MNSFNSRKTVFNAKLQILAHTIQSWAKIKYAVKSQLPPSDKKPEKLQQQTY
jgi:hypothetical protein